MSLKQKEILSELLRLSATSSHSAVELFDADPAVLRNLVRAGVVSVNSWVHLGVEVGRYWVVQPGETPTGLPSKWGVIVVLKSDITAPSGKQENLFLIRTTDWDGENQTKFRALLKVALSRLGLNNKDLSGGIPSERISYNDPVFIKPYKHVVVEL